MTNLVPLTNYTVYCMAASKDLVTPRLNKILDLSFFTQEYFGKLFKKNRRKISTDS